MDNNQDDSSQDDVFPAILEDEKELRLSKWFLVGAILTVPVLIGLFVWMDSDGLSKELVTCQVIALALTAFPIYQATRHYLETRDYNEENRKKPQENQE